MKKQYPLYASEEDHLAEMSTSSPSTTKTVKKSSKKSSSKSTSVSKHGDGEMTMEVNSSGELQKKESSFPEIKKKKTKKSKKPETVVESISVKSSFNKFDAIQKRNIEHDESKLNCKLCSKPVFKMEEIKAEKSVYHKNCFRCHECNKQLKVDTYQSHEGHPYCMIHFKLLFAPKVIEETDDSETRKPELIIRENEPEALPPDVVRASDMPNLGLEDLHQLNVRSRFQIFEKGLHQEKKEPLLAETEEPRTVKRSTNILSKVAKLQARGFSDSIDGENVIPAVASSSSEQEDSSSSMEDDGDDGEDVDLVRAKKRSRERPVGIGKAMDDIKTKFEKGPFITKDVRREQRKQEIQNIRSRLFMGKQAKSKEMYQQAVADAEQAIVAAGQKPEIELDGVARSLKERFENGEIFKSDNGGDEKEIKPDKIKAETSEISEKFKFFETYRPTAHEKKEFRITPPREGVVKLPSPERSDFDQSLAKNAESNLLEQSRTTAKMLDKFREMELNKHRKRERSPRPLKCFTPPPDGGRRMLPPADDSEEESGEDSEESSEEEQDDLDEDERNARRREKLLHDDEALKEAQAAARAKKLRAKFEKWEAGEIQRETHDIGRTDITTQADEANIESTKSIRARFENMKAAETRPVRPRYQINRFV